METATGAGRRPWLDGEQFAHGLHRFTSLMSAQVLRQGACALRRGERPHARRSTVRMVAAGVPNQPRWRYVAGADPNLRQHRRTGVATHISHTRGSSCRDIRAGVNQHCLPLPPSKDGLPLPCLTARGVVLLHNGVDGSA